jgi:hypothetical protein
MAPKFACPGNSNDAPTVLQTEQQMFLLRESISGAPVSDLGRKRC